MIIGIAAGGVNVYSFVFCGVEKSVIITVAANLCKWFMVLGLFGAGVRFLNRENAATRYLTDISYPFFSFHFVFVVLFQYLVKDLFGDKGFLLYIIPVILPYIATFISSQLALVVPALRFLVGVKPKKQTE